MTAGFALAVARLAIAERSEARAPLRTPGRTLRASVRQAMEARFDHNFAEVCVHDDDTVHRAAVALGARAFAVGRHVMYGRDVGVPEQSDGARLLAHKLASLTKKLAHSPGWKRSSGLPIALPEGVERSRGELTAIWVPDGAYEAMRDLVRTPSTH